jgi:DNA (cytosine-5)-methyltransferase 1
LKYISLFSGIGGLEHPSVSPILMCESDSECRRILGIDHPNTELFDDVSNLKPPTAEVVAGGWPCQDISAAGKQTGLTGAKSSLFYEMIRIGKESGCHSIVAENVPNLIRMNKGNEFHSVLNEFSKSGFPYISWRTLNSREFDLPQDRKRLFIVASKSKDISLNLFRRINIAISRKIKPRVDSFYWTAGVRSLCYSEGYSPTLKVGASDGNGRGNVAVFFDSKIRKLKIDETLRLQGFKIENFATVSDGKMFQMAGNAVAKPVGEFAMSSITVEKPVLEYSLASFSAIEENGFMENGDIWGVDLPFEELCNNLEDYINLNDLDEISFQAASGILVRCSRNSTYMPLELMESLIRISQIRIGKIKGSRSNSVEVLDNEIDLLKYEKFLLGENNNLMDEIKQKTSQIEMVF